MSGAAPTNGKTGDGDGGGQTQSSSASSSSSSSPPRRAKDTFGDCALVEIIHLHDCFRGALKNLEMDVSELCREITLADASASAAAEAEAGDAVPSSMTRRVVGMNDDSDAADGRVCDLERRVAGRFTVIWSVFKAHSAAEDEFIWPALKAKQVALPPGAGCGCASDCASGGGDPPIRAAAEVQAPAAAGQGSFDGEQQQHQQQHQPQHQPQEQQRERAQSMTVHTIEQEEYEEDHADEERMFNSIDGLLSNLRDELSNRRGGAAATASSLSSSPSGGRATEGPSLCHLAHALLESTGDLMRNLMTHLDKEETHCMPLVAQYLTKAEINDLVGKIMGKRSSELMSQILTMAVQNLDVADRDDMVRYMKQAMVGTFFERWLKMGGWIDGAGQKRKVEGGNAASARGAEQEEENDGGGKLPPTEAAAQEERGNDEVADLFQTMGNENDAKPAALTRDPPGESSEMPGHSPSIQPHAAVAAAAPPPAAASALAVASPRDEDEEGTPREEKYTSAAELERLIRAIGTNPRLDPQRKNMTIQGLRDSVWKSNCRLSKRKREEALAPSTTATTATATATEGEQMPPAQRRATSAAVGAAASSSQRDASVGGGYPSQAHHMCFSVTSGAATRFKRETPPSSYYKKTKDGEVKLVWSSDPHSAQFHPNDGSVPLFSASELAPTYHDGGINQVLGCPHYARSCKLRHPDSGRLYTCRLCCEQDREMTTKDKDSPLDRYEVSEILCMQCGALQPAGEACVNPNCLLGGKPFARYTCKICNFYDDSSTKDIYHCPFCNVCRTGKGLGIDYRHCMRCNACVSLKDDHHCIPQRLQGNCPICHETMFESTEPLRGLRCGHVMHLSCFSMYMRGHNYTCPLCKKSADDMSEYFALLDSAVRMQPMPPAYAAMTSNIYCQDCCKMGNVPYHFVGLKCHHCGSYNTRELQRVDANIMAGMWQGH